MSAPTPAPWSLVQQRQQIVIVGPKKEIVACTGVRPLALTREMQADARLIAAAPELLDALRVVLDEITPGRRPYDGDSHLPDHIVEQCRAALMAATERSEVRA